MLCKWMCSLIYNYTAYIIVIINNNIIIITIIITIIIIILVVAAAVVVVIVVIIASPSSPSSSSCSSSSCSSSSSTIYIYIVYMVYRFVYASLTIIGIHGSIPRFQPCLKTQGAFSWRHSAPLTGNEEQQAAVCCAYPWTVFNNGIQHEKIWFIH